MNRPRRDIALFDLLPEDADDPKSLLLPDGRKEPETASKRSIPATQRRTDTRTSDEARNGVEHSGGAVEPFFSLNGERIRLSFSSFTAGVAIFAVMVVLFGAYELGRRSGDFAGFRRGHAEGRDSYAAETLGEIAEARQQEPTPHLVDSLLNTEVSGNESATVEEQQPSRESSAGWIEGYTYIVAQEFGVGRVEDARRAQAFLAANDVSTEMVERPIGSTQLITSQGYDLGQPTQRKLAEDLREKIRTIGRAYFASGGGYKLEGYFKTLKARNW